MNQYPLFSCYLVLLAVCLAFMGLYFLCLKFIKQKSSQDWWHSSSFSTYTKIKNLSKNTQNPGQKLVLLWMEWKVTLFDWFESELSLDFTVQFMSFYCVKINKWFNKCYVLKEFNVFCITNHTPIETGNTCQVKKPKSCKIVIWISCNTSSCRRMAPEHCNVIKVNFFSPFLWCKTIKTLLY